MTTNITNNRNNCKESNKLFYIQQGMKENIENSLSESEKKHIDKYLYCLHAINTGYVINKSIEAGDWVPLNMRTLQNIITWRHSGKVKNFLLDNGFIECDEFYSKQYHKSFGYKISRDYLTSPLTRHKSTDTRLNERINTAQINCDFSNPVLSEALNNLNQIKVNYSEAVGFICSKFSGVLPSFLPNQSNNNPTLPPYDTTFPEKPLKQAKNATFQFTFDVISIDKIHNIQKGEAPIFIRDKTGNRLHTNLTNLRSELRKYISVPGLDLVNVDIANSQPFLLCTLLTKLNEPDVNHYRELTSAGKLWGYLMGESGYQDKRKFKRLMFRDVFYGKPGKKRLSKPARMFKNNFPTVWDFIIEFKIDDVKKNYSRLAIEMQKREAGIIIDTVCRKLAKRKIFFLTIHDSIIVDKEASENCVSEIKSAFHAKYGITPTLKIEKL